jgi:dienelactone hydrolase
MPWRSSGWRLGPSWRPAPAPDAPAPDSADPDAGRIVNGPDVFAGTWWPGPGPLSQTGPVAIIDDQSDSTTRRRELDLEANTRIVPAVLWSPPTPQPGAPLVCLGHGASGDRHQQPLPWLASRLVSRHGWFALSIDGPVHGRRLVPPGGREAFWPEWKRAGTVEDMVADWRAALDHVQSWPDVGSGPVGYWGLSMGTIYGAPLVAAENRIGAAVLGLMGLTGPAHYLSAIQAAAAAITCPVLFVVQLEDELFTRDQCLGLFDALASEDKRLHANPGLHPEVPVEELRHSLSFLVDNLSGRAAERGPTFVVAE